MVTQQNLLDHAEVCSRSCERRATEACALGSLIYRTARRPEIA